MEYAQAARTKKYTPTHMKIFIFLALTIVLSACSANNTPSINVQISKDSESGWNLFLKTTNFTWTPENATSPHKKNKGHAHIYINGFKTSRIYSPWHYIKTLPEGSNTIQVVLSQNNHVEYLSNNQLISDTTIVLSP
jgi:hypothetical protein